MRATTIHATRDIRLSDVPDPRIEADTDAIVKVMAACICGSDLWPYRGENDITPGDTIGHECIGVVEEVGSEVRSFRAGDFVLVPFCHCDNTCAHCRAGMQSACTNMGITLSGQAEYAKVNPATLDNESTFLFRAIWAILEPDEQRITDRAVAHARSKYLLRELLRESPDSRKEPGQRRTYLRVARIIARRRGTLTARLWYLVQWL